MDRIPENEAEEILDMLDVNDEAPDVDEEIFRNLDNDIIQY